DRTDARIGVADLPEVLDLDVRSGSTPVVADKEVLRVGGIASEAGRLLLFGSWRSEEGLGREVDHEPHVCHRAPPGSSRSRSHDPPEYARGTATRETGGWVSDDPWTRTSGTG